MVSTEPTEGVSVMVAVDLPLFFASTSACTREADSESPPPLAGEIDSQVALDTAVQVTPGRAPTEICLAMAAGRRADPNEGRDVPRAWSRALLVTQHTR